jgi:hypothetical protein
VVAVHVETGHAEHGSDELHVRIGQVAAAEHDVYIAEPLASVRTVDARHYLVTDGEDLYAFIHFEISAF